MERARLTEEQIIRILRENKAGAKAGELAREHGVSEGAIYAWKAKSGSRSVSEAQRLRALVDEKAWAASFLRHGAPDDVTIGLALGGEPGLLPLVRKAGHAALGRCCGAAMAWGDGHERHDESIRNTCWDMGRCPVPLPRAKISTKTMRPPRQGQAAGGFASGSGSARIPT